MAGTIRIGSQTWTAAGWLFDFVLTELAALVQTTELAGELRGIVAENLGWLAVDDLPPTQHDELLNTLQGPFLARVDDDLPGDLTPVNRSSVMSYLREHVELGVPDS